MKINSFFRLPIFIIVSFLTACSSVLDTPTEVAKIQSIPHDDQQWQQHIRQVKSIKSYKTKGQFGYISKQPKERFSANFDWKYNNQKQFTFLLSSNLSSQTIKLQRTPKGLTLTDNKGNRKADSNANNLLKQTLGFSFPIELLGNWLKGLPPRDTDYIVNPKRQLVQFDYSLNNTIWQIKFIKYNETKQPNLPELIVLQNGNQTLKIRIDNWIY